MKKSTLFLIILSSFLFVTTLVFAYLNYFSSPKPPAITQTITQSTDIVPTEAVIPPTDPTADWKTYEDKENKFSFDYPMTYVVTNKNISKDQFVMVQGKDYHIETNDFGSKNIGSYYYFGINLSCEPMDIVGDKKIISSTQSYTIYSISGYEGPNYKSALIKNNGLCYEFTCSSDTNCAGPQFDEFSQILSTFKFIK